LKQLVSFKDTGDKKSGVENFPPPIPGQGKSRDLAAGKLGVSGWTAEKAEIKNRVCKILHPFPMLQYDKNRLQIPKHFLFRLKKVLDIDRLLLYN
jgi:hypothetical protein